MEKTLLEVDGEKVKFTGELGCVWMNYEAPIEVCGDVVRRLNELEEKSYDARIIKVQNRVCKHMFRTFENETVTESIILISVNDKTILRLEYGLDPNGYVTIQCTETEIKEIHQQIEDLRNTISTLDPILVERYFFSELESLSSFFWSIHSSVKAQCYPGNKLIRPIYIHSSFSLHSNDRTAKSL